MIRRHRPAHNRHLSRLANLSDHIAGTLGHFAPQDLVPVLRDPDPVILDLSYRVPAGSVFHHRSPPHPSELEAQAYRLKAVGLNPGASN